MYFQSANIGSEKRLIGIKYILLAALASGIALSYNLWLTETRYFPLTPLLDFLPVINYPFDYFLLFITILFIAVSFVYPFNFLLNISLFGVLIFLALLDINRFQPWFYQYLLMVLIFCSTIRKQNPAILVPSLQLLICGIYFWSGIFKFNGLYFSNVVPWFANPLNESAIIEFIGKLLPVLELFASIGLLTKQIRKWALFTIIFIHLYYLLVLGPLGNNANDVLLPWNIVMPLFSVLLFTGENIYLYKDLKGFFKLKTTKMVLLLVWILPIFNLFNLWPAYTSFNIFSGNTNNGSLYISDYTKKTLPEEISSLVKNNALNIKEWSLKELNVPAFPEKKVFISARNFMYNYAADSSEVVLYYQAKTKLTGDSEAKFY